MRRTVLGLCLLLAACDTVELPTERLVVEAFVQPGVSLPEITVRRTTDLDAADPTRPIVDASVTLTLASEPIPYIPVTEVPGQYRPSEVRSPLPGDPIEVEVVAEVGQATATSTLPVPIRLDSVRITPATAPVAAVFADSLGLSLEEGFIYPVTAELFWTVPEVDTAWVRARIQPPSAFPSAVVDFVFEDERIEEETEFDSDGVVRSWRGSYAVPVEAASDELPPHEIDLALVRSGEDYARYAISRTAPDRREPVGNVEGGLGIVVGLAIDREVVSVE